MKAKIQLTIGIVSLIALLVYTLAHTGALLASYVNPGFIGYVAAFGIEGSIVSLSLRIGELRKSKQSAKFFYFVLVSVVIVSAIANIAEGFSTLYNESLTVSNLRQLDLIQAVIGVTATGLISLIVLALSEIVGTDVTQVVKLVERESSQNVSHTGQNAKKPGSVETARQAKMLQDAETIEMRHQTIITALRDNPQADVTELATMTNVSRQTIYRDINNLVTSGTLEKNGNGYKVSQ